MVTLERAEAWAAELTPMLRHPRAGLAALRPWQGMALGELAENRGLYGGLPVGTGKTLITWLAPTVVDAVRPVVLVPASLKEKTYSDFRAFRGVWTQTAPILVVTYEELTQVDKVDYLFRLDPDLLICDESDCLRNEDASATKRVDRFVRERQSGKPMVMCLTGTPGRLSILDYAHQLIWCLDDGAPVPLGAAERETWALAIDEKAPRVGKRPAVGALTELGGSTVEGVREAFGRRLRETPGVLLVDEDSCDQPLTVRVTQAPPDPAIDAAFETFRTTWSTPDGWPLSDPLSVFRHAGELGTGMYLKWDPRPPDWWLIPRKEFCSMVRYEIDRSARTKHPLDTELAVRRAYPDAPEVVAWLEAKAQPEERTGKPFEPNSVPVWLTGSVVQYAREWMREGGLVWCWNSAFGEALSRASGAAYYGSQGLDLHGRSITVADPSKPAILSVAANMRGRNLQAWWRNLVVNPPQSARYLEQIVGRTHRAGQTRGVLLEILATSGDVLDGFESAWREAMFSRATTSISQKLLRARIERANVQVTPGSAYRWARKERNQNQ